MGCCSSFEDQFQECGFLIEEFKLIVTKLSSKQYTENEIKALNTFKCEKEEQIREIIEEFEKSLTDEIQRRKIAKLKEEFYDVLDEDEK